MIVTVSGNIGVGKSTLLQLIQSRMRLKVVPEEAGGSMFLPRFVESPSRWTLETALWFAIHRVERYEMAKEGHAQDALIERSLGDDHNVFLPAFVQMGWLKGEDIVLMATLLKSLISNNGNPDAYICLQCRLPTLFSRIERRARQIECAYGAEYLRILNERCEIWHSEISGKKLILRTDEMAPQEVACAAEDFLAKLGVERR
jgi:deoxyadenosine/deoxycytidine kinase